MPALKPFDKSLFPQQHGTPQASQRVHAATACSAGPSHTIHPHSAICEARRVESRNVIQTSCHSCCRFVHLHTHVHNRTWLQQPILHMAAAASEWLHTVTTLLQVLDWLRGAAWGCVHRERRPRRRIQQQHRAVPALRGLQHGQQYTMCDGGSGQFLLPVQVVVRGKAFAVCTSMKHAVACASRARHSHAQWQRTQPLHPALPSKHMKAMAAHKTMPAEYDFEPGHMMRRLQVLW